jgi:LysM repeat protein
MGRPFIVLCITALLYSSVMPAYAKRANSKPVKPVVFNGVKYVAPNDRGRVCYVQAWDVSQGNLLWERIIYEVPIDPTIEEDVQYNFITALSTQDGSLLVRTESMDNYVLDLKTKGVRKQFKPKDPPGKHIVQAGESLSGIALRHGVSIHELATLNSIRNPDKIVAGQELLLPNPEKETLSDRGHVSTIDN